MRLAMRAVPRVQGANRYPLCSRLAPNQAFVGITQIAKGYSCRVRHSRGCPKLLIGIVHIERSEENNASDDTRCSNRGQDDRKHAFWKPAETWNCWRVDDRECWRVLSSCDPRLLELLRQADVDCLGEINPSFQ